jgi:hypothetical protein
LDDSNIEAINHCRGLCTLQWWIRTEIMKRITEYFIPAPFIAYNQYMSGVAKIDQLRSANITRHHEKQLYMTMFIKTLDLAVHQAFSFFVFTSLKYPIKAIGNIKYFSSSNLVLSLIQPEMKTHHILVWKKDRAQDIPCYLCRLCRIHLRTIYGCPQCKVGFPVECFTALILMTDNPMLLPLTRCTTITYTPYHSLFICIHILYFFRCLLLSQHYIYFFRCTSLL